MFITSKTPLLDTQLRNSKTLNSIAVPSTQASANQQRDNTELQLLKLLQQHRDVDGWIVLIAPEVKPNKQFWAQ